MRKIKLNKWLEKDREGKENDTDLRNIITIMVGNQKPDEMPRGIDNFRTMNRISNAFEKADADGELVLEETEYTYIKKILEKGIPAIWGANKDISEAIDAFFEAKGE